MMKLDLPKTDKAYFSAKATPHIISIPQTQYLSLAGKGDPSSAEFSKVIEALYTTAYTLKFQHKTIAQDFVVSKLEGLWWYDEKEYKNISMEEAPTMIPRSAWEYRLLIRLPDYISRQSIDEAKASAFRKKALDKIHQIEFFTLNEGKAAQILHVGSFATEFVSLKKLQVFMNENGFKKNGLHHEVYLSDFRKTPEAKLKTILREPIG